MDLNQTPSANRTHIGFFGRRNAGKSSVLNAVTGQDIAIVSDVLGTTTDPVQKAMELLPLGPVVMIDTPGIDDEGELGKSRVEKSYKVLNKVDIAVLVIDANKGAKTEDQKLIKAFEERGIPFIIAFNKSDTTDDIPTSNQKNEISISAKTGYNINALKELIASIAAQKAPQRPILSDFIKPLDVVVLIVPIDSAAPKGRLILPQQQVIRELLDIGAICVVTRELEYEKTLSSLKQKPRLVITDSQAFGEVAKMTPNDVLLTSFSILLARQKGNLDTAVRGVFAVEKLKENDKILIAEGCTHHRQCDDIGTVKIPKFLRNYTKKDFDFEFCSGTGYPEDLSKYALIIHCGGCMQNDREMQHRYKKADTHNIPITNYGILIAYLKGILKKSITPLPEYENLKEGFIK